MSYHLLYESCGWHTRCALFDEHGRLLTLRYDDISRRFIEGALVWGRVRQVAPSLGAAFVDIGDTHDGLLALNTVPPEIKLTEGMGLVLRITRSGFGEKGAKLSAKVAYKVEIEAGAKPYVVHPAPKALQRALRDAGSMPVKVWLPHGVFREAVAALVPERQIFMLEEHGDAPDLLGALDDELARMLSVPMVFPFTGGDVVIELTSAVATIDVNFKPLVGPMAAIGKGDAVLAANLTAAETVARLVRLLDLGGSVIVDFITPKSKAQREMVHAHLDAALGTTDDYFEHARPLSPNGLCELTRTRTGPSIMLLLRTAPFVAGAVGLQLWRTPAGRNPNLRQQTVQANPEVATLLQQQLKPEDCLRHLGRPVQVLADATLALAEIHLAG